jgi:DNA-binding CsgD family transcriptional regulator
MQLAHPVYGDVLRTRLPLVYQREVARILAAAVEASGARRREDILRVGRWGLVSGSGRPELLLEAATTARWHYDFALAERLARAAVDAGAGFDAALLAAQLAGIQGRSAAAEEALAAMAESAAEDVQRARVATARIDNFVYSNRVREAGTVAEAATASLGDAELRDEIKALYSAVPVQCDGPRATVELVEPLLGRTAGPAFVWACLTGAHGLARLGRLGLAIEVTDRGYGAHRRLVTPLQWYPWFHLFNRCEALLFSGRLHEAEALANAQYERGVADRSPEARAYFASQLARILIHRGRVSTAAHYADEAVRLFRDFGRPSFVGESLQSLAMALALGGQTHPAAEALAGVAELGRHPDRYYAVELLEAQACAAAAAGDIALAVERLEAAVALGTGIGHLMGASDALHRLAVLGRPADAVGPLEALAASVEGELIRARVRHVRALVDGDAPALDAVSTAFATMGADVLAAEAAAGAASAWYRAGSARAAAASEREADRCLGRCEGVRTPVLATLATPTLTAAERTAAFLAAAGKSNRQIAEELVLSIRTVENRLQHVYEKLGVRSRWELAAILHRPA